ncbi:MAG TPA: hypothetical protein VFV99_03775, partial [Kofleriaceae bacterium]|nr:hypothetical protein [Kofleriaceae bacterium]
MTTPRDQLDLECEIVYLRALIAIAARDRNEDDAQRLRQQLATAGALHDGWERTGAVRTTPMARLVERYALTPLETELVWAIIATSADPRLAIPLEALWGAGSRRGISVAAFTHLRGVPSDAGRDLALWLAQRSALVAGGLIVATDTSAP